jgi:hypothetical protein
VILETKSEQEEKAMSTSKTTSSKQKEKATSTSNSTSK